MHRNYFRSIMTLRHLIAEYKANFVITLHCCSKHVITAKACLHSPQLTTAQFLLPWVFQFFLAIAAVSCGQCFRETKIPPQDGFFSHFHQLLLIIFNLSRLFGVW